MEFYEPAELEQVLARSAALLGVELTAEGSAEIAGRSRGTPRIANRLLRRVRDYTLVHTPSGVADVASVRAALDLYEVDALGLDRLDRQVMLTLLQRFSGGPVGLNTLAVSVGEEAETIEAVVEPFLVRIGLITRTPRGRVATPEGWRHFGLRLPGAAPTLDDL
jgi:holliday junction DNA helicase RuvB